MSAKLLELLFFQIFNIQSFHIFPQHKTGACTLRRPPCKAHWSAKLGRFGRSRGRERITRTRKPLGEEASCGISAASTAAKVNQYVDLSIKSQKRLIWIAPEEIKALEPDQKNFQDKTDHYRIGHVNHCTGQKIKRLLFHILGPHYCLGCEYQG